MGLVEFEIARWDWKTLRCGCGKNGLHLADELLALARAEREGDSGFDVSSGHVMLPSVLMEPSLPVVSVALAAVADQTSAVARHQFLEALLFILSADSQTWELENEGRDLLEECRIAALPGIWLLHREVYLGPAVGASSLAFECLTLLDDNVDRLERVRADPRAQLAPHVRNAEL
ncbi:hypothetical protein AB0I85_14395 [Micromonospora echinofusca]|uniref:hypothetical protein n=1 Tax=Micromonospora echinofusca TaxID=47858 RepID=UPI003403E9A0